MNHSSNDPSNNKGPRKADPDVMAAIAAALAAEEAAEQPSPTAAATPMPSAATQPAATPPEDEESVAIYHEHNGNLTKDEVDAMLEESHVIKQKRKGRQRIYANLTLVFIFLGICGGAYGWYASSEVNQAKVHDLWGNVTAFTSGESKEGLSDMIDAYDDSLDKIAVRGEQVRVATAALGANPDAVDPEGNAKLEAEIKELTGSETSTLDRNKLVQEKFGGVTQVLRAKVDADREKREADEEAKAAE